MSKKKAAKTAVPAPATPAPPARPGSAQAFVNRLQALTKDEAMIAAEVTRLSTALHEVRGAIKLCQHMLGEVHAADQADAAATAPAPVPEAKGDNNAQSAG